MRHYMIVHYDGGGGLSARTEGSGTAKEAAPADFNTHYNYYEAILKYVILVGEPFAAFIFFVRGVYDRTCMVNHIHSCCLLFDRCPNGLLTCLPEVHRQLVLPRCLSIM